MKADICIIGAGPAGLMTAVTAAKSGAGVLVAESNSSAARKLLVTGRQRCNITHDAGINDFVRAYGTCGRFLKHALHTFSPGDTRQYFRRHGLETKVENSGCVFPVSNRAADVKNVLLKLAKENNIRFVYGKPVERVDFDRDLFTIDTASVTVRAASLVIATGGKSWPHTGSTGKGYKLAESLGHTIIDPKPALVPLVTKENWPSELQGIGIPEVKISAKINNDKYTSTGAMMFTEDGIGGPAVFDISRKLADAAFNSKEGMPVNIDFLPHSDTQLLEKHLIDVSAGHPKKSIASVLNEYFPKAFANQLCRLSQTLDTASAQLSKVGRKSLIRSIRQMPLIIKRFRPMEQAIITSGGVDLSQIDPVTMHSKICPGLYFAGEVIDADGPCGGYNLQIAWSTGYLAGKTLQEIYS